METASYWMQVDSFTVSQAAALWCGIDPASTAASSFNPHPEVLAVQQMLTAAIIRGELVADPRTNGLHIIGDHSKSYVSRVDLVEFARKKGLFPAFLFDTLAPFEPAPLFGTPLAIRQASNTPLQKPIVPPIEPPPNRGGRPPEYDWDSFMLEIVARANTPDGLPETRAELTKDMLNWFQSRFGTEPAESNVRDRISKIYKYLENARNLGR